MIRQFLFSISLWGMIALLVSAASASTAQATCGDYVHISVNTSAEFQKSKSKLPCRGPNCTADHSTPASPLPPAGNTVQTSPSDALLATFDLVSDPDCLIWPDVSNVMILSSSHSAIFVPPRLG
ncbi:MAG: hypothetical protein U0798_11780 [Gemmataceae bacterium]